MTTRTLTGTGAATDLLGLLGAAVLGLVLIYFAGISQMHILHDAAHDTRHALSFPCH